MAPVTGFASRGGNAAPHACDPNRSRKRLDWNQTRKSTWSTFRACTRVLLGASIAARPLFVAPTMIRLGTHIRLTRPEVERLLRLTDIEPVDIRTPADLDAYVARCKAHYWGRSRDTQFLHWLIDQERARLDVAA